MDQHLELFAALAAPFAHDEVRVRPQGNWQIQYITARTVMNRLDEILGPANWWDEYRQQENCIVCRLTVRLPDGQVITKEDAGGHAGMSDQGDDEKSAHSDAFKRAAVKFGIGRYLYRDGIPKFVQERFQNHPDRLSHHDREPEQDGHTRPQPHQNGPAQAATPQPAAAAARGADGHSVPQTGKALFAWIKYQDETHGLDLLKRLSEWAARQDFPARMLQWSDEQVHRAFEEAQGLLAVPTAPASRRPLENGGHRAEPARQEPELAQGRARRGR
jgi:hypothetical protein